MKALYLVEKGKIEFRDIPEPRCGPGEVLVRVRACGICGSDAHYYRSGGIGAAQVSEPMILGHEASGDVLDVGADVRGLTAGMRVAIEPQIPCGTCRHCQSGRYNLCPDVRFMATPPVDGALTELVVVPGEFAFELPEALDYEEGAMIEPLSCSLSGAMKGEVKAGDVVAVLGAGPIGALMCACARACGAPRVVACDLVPSRLEFARGMGATHTVKVDEEDARAVVDALTEGIGADVVFETAGATPATRMTIQLVRAGGTTVWLGFGEDEVPIAATMLVRKEVRIIGNRRYAHTYKDAIRMAARGDVDVKRCITHRFPFERADEAVAFAARGDPETIKVMVNVD